MHKEGRHSCIKREREPLILHKVNGHKRRQVVGEPDAGEVVQAKIHVKDEDLLGRCLVGNFSGKDNAPTRNEVRSRAQQTWRGAPGIKMYNMNGSLFLFKFHTRKEAEHVLMGDWTRKGNKLNLQWWTPRARAFSKSQEFEWFWIHILRLPLHSWSQLIMKKIGERRWDDLRQKRRRS